MGLYHLDTVESCVPERARAPKPTGPGFPADIAERGVKMVIQGTDVMDPEEYTRFQLYDASGELIGDEKVPGY